MRELRDPQTRPPGRSFISPKETRQKKPNKSTKTMCSCFGAADTAGLAQVYQTEGGACESALQAHMQQRSARKGSPTAEDVAAAHNWKGDGKVVIITGCNTGLGQESARVLAARGADVVMAVRDTARGQQAADAIRAQHPNAQLTVMQCDLSSLASVKQFAADFKKSGKPCHILLANAGIMACPFERSVDGHEMQFATNHLGHFALVQQLLPILQATGQEAGQPARVVVLSSAAHFKPYPIKAAGPLLLHSFDSERCYHPFSAYGQSKLCNLLFVRELNKRLQAEQAPVVSVACHPGLIATDIGRHIDKSVSPLLRSVARAGLAWAIKTKEQGAATQVHLCTAPCIQGGEYYANCSIAASTPASHDADLGARLWALSEKLVAQAEGGAAL